MKSPQSSRLAALVLCAAPATAAGVGVEPPAGEPGGRGLAVYSAKILVCPPTGTQVVDNGVLLVRDGRIEAVGGARELAVPEGYERLDVGERWLMPGIIELHSHVGGGMDFNDGVYLTNPGLRASAIMIPQNPYLERGLAGGVTLMLSIPGSGTNIGGQGALIKTGFAEYEDNELRPIGSMKLAQAGNPERFSWGVGRAFMNWNLRDTLRQGLAHARQVVDAERRGIEPPPRDPRWDVFVALVKGETEISVHTQIYQVTLMTCTMLAGEFGLACYIDHGTFDSWKMAAVAEQFEVPAILGPRSIDVPTRSMMGWAGSNPDRIQGVAAGYQENGHTRIGFNTDAVPMPFGLGQEELALQAAMGVRYGLDDSALATVRGLTIVPAMTARIDHRVGSLEPGKDADFLVIGGHPADPRNAVDLVFIEGHLAYDAEQGPRRF